MSLGKTLRDVNMVKHVNALLYREWLWKKGEN